MIGRRSPVLPVFFRTTKMTRLSRLALGAALAAAGAIVVAQSTSTDHSTMNHGAETAFSDAMESMMASMDAVEPTGDPDADFLLMMIPHHQSAVDTARALLEQSDDPEVAALAEAIIATQEAEIAVMTAMLERLGHPVPK